MKTSEVETLTQVGDTLNNACRIRVLSCISRALYNELLQLYIVYISCMYPYSCTAVGMYRYCSMHSDILYLPGTHWLKGIVIETVVLIAIYRYVFFIKVSFAANRILLPLCILFCFLNSSKDSCPCIRCLYSCIVDFLV